MSALFKRLIVSLFLILLPAELLALTEGKWKEEWIDTKTEVETLAGKKKVAETGTFLFIHYRKGTGIEKALGALDTAFKNANKAKNKFEGDRTPRNKTTLTKKVTAYEKKLSKFIVLKEKYIAQLKTAIDTGNTNEKKSWAILKEDLKVIEKSAQLALADFEFARDNETTDPLQKMREMSASTGGKALIKTLGEAKLFVKKAKAKDDPVFWNSEILNSARKVATAIRSMGEPEVLDRKYVAFKRYADNRHNHNHIEADELDDAIDEYADLIKDTKALMR